MSLARHIQIFKPGTHTAMGGDEISFSEDDVAAIAENYDAAVFAAPVVVGHPKVDAPAYGWVKGLQVVGGHLVAELDEVDPDFAEAVSAGRYKKVSAAFYGPANKSNPKSGAYYLRHVGFLGGAAPAVKGLKPVTEAAFGEPADLVVELGETEDNVRLIADLFSKLRDVILEQFGRESADTALPKEQVNWLHERAVRGVERSREDAQPDFAQRGHEVEAQTPAPQQQKEPHVSDDDELKAREAAIAKREAALRQSENKSFVEGLVREGRPLTGKAGEAALAFMDSLDDADMLEFGEGGGAQTQLTAFKSFLSRLPKVVEFGEINKGEDPKEASPIAFAAPDGMSVDQGGLALHAKALAHQAQNPGTDYFSAVKAVGGR